MLFFFISLFIYHTNTIKQTAGKAFNTLGQLLRLVTFNTGSSRMYSEHITSIEFKMMCLVFILSFIIMGIDVYVYQCLSLHFIICHKLHIHLSIILNLSSSQFAGLLIIYVFIFLYVSLSLMMCS